LQWTKDIGEHLPSALAAMRAILLPTALSVALAWVN
jgi:hypothetical protein